jgi:hypothetical protein
MPLRGLASSTISLGIQPSGDGRFGQSPEPWWTPCRGVVSLLKHRGGRQWIQLSWKFQPHLCSTKLRGWPCVLIQHTRKKTSGVKSAFQTMLQSLSSRYMGLFFNYYILIFYLFIICFRMLNPVLCAFIFVRQALYHLSHSPHFRGDSLL